MREMRNDEDWSEMMKTDQRQLNISSKKIARNEKKDTKKFRKWLNIVEKCTQNELKLSTWLKKMQFFLNMIKHGYKWL